jgi:hypothetical protein
LQIGVSPFHLVRTGTGTGQPTNPGRFPFLQNQAPVYSSFQFCAVCTGKYYHSVLPLGELELRASAGGRHFLLTNRPAGAAAVRRGAAGCGAAAGGQPLQPLQQPLQPPLVGNPPHPRSRGWGAAIGRPRHSIHYLSSATPTEPRVFCVATGRIRYRSDPHALTVECAREAPIEEGFVLRLAV